MFNERCKLMAAISIRKHNVFQPASIMNGFVMTGHQLTDR